MSNSLETNTSKGSKKMNATTAQANKSKKSSQKNVVQGTDIQEIEQSLDKTTLGHFVNENKNSILIAGFIVVVLAIGYSFFESKKNAVQTEVTSAIYDYQKNYVNKYFDQKKDPNPAAAPGQKKPEVKPEDKVEFATVVSEYKALSPELQNHRSMLPVNLKLINELVELNRSSEAVGIAQDFYKANLGSNEETYLMGLRLSVLLENENKVDEAIAVLEKINGLPLKWMEAKNFLDLGRLYLKKDNTKKATDNFNFLIKKYPKDEMAKLAKIYLSNISSESLEK
ncbi:hypothetical protein N9N67_02370 [Bacteriovoracaceae bacterium]|nr:hypothetical protein [Bacteriovoracaceae bacterium]